MYSRQDKDNVQLVVLRAVFSSFLPAVDARRIPHLLPAYKKDCCSLHAYAVFARFFLGSRRTVFVRAAVVEEDHNQQGGCVKLLRTVTVIYVNLLQLYQCVHGGLIASKTQSSSVYC
jgi:hypothetical protein